MRSFNAIDWSKLPDEKLVLMTVSNISDNEQMKIADFLDTQALVFVKNGCYVGMSYNRGLRFGKHPAFLINGIWYIDEDKNAQHGWNDIILSLNELSLEVIK
jgi:hypothetical protein